MTELKQKRGFALLSPAERQAMAARGGAAAHEQGRAHSWTSETARVAGAKGLAARGLAVIPDAPGGNNAPEPTPAGPDRDPA